MTDVVEPKTQFQVYKVTEKGDNLKNEGVFDSSDSSYYSPSAKELGESFGAGRYLCFRLDAEDEKFGTSGSSVRGYWINVVSETYFSQNYEDEPQTP